ncbi:YhgE/Pip domain-containing protein [Clostridium sp.]|uniref:YhgE/Pip domain-containing protein n=1 Tax=Clostridium sp. TaxID=1506 RepID=UPI003463951C
MKNIFRIYKRDIKSIINNPIALIVVLALIFLPSLYAWFNIEASWDPYGSTFGISVAVANKDKGVTIKDKNINVGDEVISSLKENHDIGWKFVDEEEAIKGTEEGKYYASIIIPENFSTDITSILNGEFKKPELDYYINEKINAIAPKITDKGASSVQQQISENFVKTVNGAILSGFNVLGEDLAKYEPKFNDYKNLINTLNDRFPEIYEKVDLVEKGVITGEDLINTLNEQMPLIEDTLNKGEELSKDFEKFTREGKENINKIAPVIKNDLVYVRDISIGVESIVNSLSESSAPEDIKTALISLKSKANIIRAVIDTNINIIDKINISNSEVLNNLKGRLEGIRNKVDKYISTIDKGISAIDKGEKPAKDILQSISSLSKDISSSVNTILEEYDSKIIPEINRVADKLHEISLNSVELVGIANSKLPEVKSLISNVDNLTAGGEEKIKVIKDKLPEAQDAIKNVKEKIEELDGKVDVGEFIDILKTDAEKGKEFIASPVVLNENKLFHIPNYGSGMTPFYTVLALWVGGLILSSILSVKVPSDLERPFKPYEVYFGKSLLFTTIGILQALCVSVGDIYLLGTYAAHKPEFIWISVLIGIVFMFIIYTMVSVFGNVGKALGIIGLVIQVAASGGTFPIQVTPPFFQKVNPYLPFTYAIEAMREATGGIIWSVFYKDIIILCLILLGVIVFGLILKGPLNRKGKRFVDKLHESKIIEH